MTRHEYKQGRKFRVIKPGAHLHGMQPVRGGQQGWSQPLPVGTILTCNGVSMSFGDGVPLVKWTDAQGQWLANDCELSPSIGGMWNLLPDPSFLEPLGD